MPGNCPVFAKVREALPRMATDGRESARPMIVTILDVIRHTNMRAILQVIVHEGPGRTPFSSPDSWRLGILM